MTVSTIASVAAGLTRALGSQNNKASAVFNSLVASTPQSAAVDSLSVAINLQNQVAQFRVASRDVAQASAVISTAEAGANDIGKQLAKLRDIAARAASPALAAEERAQLNGEFQSIARGIDRTVAATRFNGESLLDGQSAQLKVASGEGASKDLSIGSLGSATLFKGVALDVSTSSGAKVAETTLGAAQGYVDTQLANLKTLQTGLDYAASTLQTAIQNQAASRSTLEEADFTTQLFGGTSSNAAAGGLNSLIAQTRGMPANILQLLAE